MSGQWPLLRPISPLRRELTIAYLGAAAVASHLLESAIPGLGPWFKPGLANIFTLVALFHLGWRAAAAVSLIRVLAGSIFLGSFLAPTFWLSLAGACGAVGIMGMMRWLPIRWGPVGVSVAASICHMAAQVVAAWWLLIGHSGIFFALPWFMIGSWITGIGNGLLAFLILERVERQLQGLRS